MKKIVYSILLLSLSLFIFSACDDFLDAFPKDKVVEDNYWKSVDDAEKILVDIYASTLPKDPYFEECMSDNAYMAWEWWGGQQQFANGTYNAYSDIPVNKWSNCYSSIRKCWFLLEGCEKMTIENQEDKNRLLGETYFLLAYNYYILTSLFGDVPLITQKLTIEESKSLTRTPKANVVEYALDQLKKASNLLSGINQERGRITSDACLALMARIYLYNGEYENVLETIKPLEGKYALYKEGDTPYEDLFSGAAENNCEIILSIICSQKVGDVSCGHSANGAMMLKGMSAGDPYNGISPSGSLVDSYPMSDGRLIHESGSAYNPSKPYENRDPRFYQSIIYPTSQLKYWDTKSGKIQECLYDPEDPTTIPVQQYDAPEPSRSGYVWNKYLDYSTYAMNEIWDCTNDIVIFRYAEILLMKAEALLQTKGEVAKSEVCNLIDQLRTRCKGGGRVHRENYNSKEDLMCLLKNERRIELANEGLRFFDLVRWRDAEKNVIQDGVGLSGEMYGAYMRLDGVGAGDRTVLVDGVPRRYIETRIFDTSKHYLLPVPQKERDLAPGLSQNPNW
ncbi:RagB/SusD family nutrient uptake outer membrane protein [Phocaeicola plebeius]|uniref:RagB/SusD family nutrient uptake outer membrane protein n=1 Tax=Phocaeicola plebeius TaxID=310297 RepID=UPI0026F1A0C2|nr:RagB/SusD family nutrient uptake outer membrane protein [Phocaeicola plebeius]